MDNIKFIYTVDSDLDDELLYAEFETKDAAIAYAMRNLDKLPFVNEVEIEIDSYSGIEDALSYNTIWDHTMVEGTTEEPDDDYWDDLATMYDDTDKHDLGDTTWFESMNNLVETLEDNEDTVECKECFDLFPKADCIKLAVGYVCPTCAECGTVSEDEIFKIDFPEYEKFSDGNAMVPDEPTIPVEPTEEVPAADPEDEIIPISTPEEAVPFLVNDEEEAIAGYDKAAEVVAESDLENKEEILDTIEHIKEEEEEHIEELTELVDPKEEKDSEEEDETEPASEDEEEEVEEIEDPEAEPVEEAMSDFQRGMIDRLPKITKDEFQQKLESGDSETIFTGDPRERGIRGRTYEASYDDGKYVVSFWDETYNEDFTDSEVVEEFDNIDDLWSFLVNFMEDDDFSPEYNYLADELTEHVNQENPAIESDQELEGTDNAVVDCKIADVVTHSEDEKPLHEEFDRVRAAAQCSKKCYDFYNAVATNAPEKELKKHGKVAYKFVKDQFGLTGKKAEDLLISGYAVWRLLNGKSKYESLTEATTDEFQEILDRCKELGIETGADINRFIRDEVKKDETVLDRLRSYRSELGDEFKIEEKLTEAKRDPFHEAIFEAIDYLTEFSDIFPVPGNIGANNWEELKDDINYGLSSDFEIAEILMDYMKKDIAIGEKHPKIFEEDPQSELTLETYNRLKRAYDKAVADYEAANPEDFEEQLELKHGYPHIQSVASIVHTAVDNFTKDNRVGTRPDGTSIYVLSDKRSANPEKMKKVILDALTAEGYEPDEVQFVDKGQVYGYVIGKIKMIARATMSYQKKEGLTESVSLNEAWILNHITNAIADQAKQEVIDKLTNYSYTNGRLNIPWETSFHTKETIIDFNIIDNQANIIIERVHTDAFSKEVTTSTRTMEASFAKANARTGRPKALAFLKEFETVVKDVNRAHNIGVRARRTIAVQNALTPELAKEFKQHITDITYRIPLQDIYTSADIPDVYIKQDGTEIIATPEDLEKAADNLSQIRDEFLALDFADFANVVDRPLLNKNGDAVDSAFNMGHDWRPIAKISFDCKLGDLTHEAQQLIFDAQVNSSRTELKADARQIDCYRLANALARYYGTATFYNTVEEDLEMTADELKDKFGTDDVEIINAGREEEPVVLKEDTDEPLTTDPAEDPSEDVQMANTASTSGMDFEAACAKFGIKLDN